MVNILPGEPVPPGFEDEIRRASSLQQTIDATKNTALIGLEYTIELQSENDKECKCLCTLCNKNLVARNAIAHWSSTNHRMKYMEKHFPSAVNALNPARQQPNSHNIIANILKRLAIAIEQHYGRMTPLMLPAVEYNRYKAKYNCEVNSRTHFDEDTGPKFLEVIDQALADLDRNKKKDNNCGGPQITIKVPEHINSEFDAEVTRMRDEHPIDLDEISSDSDDNLSKTDGQPEKKKHKRQEQQPAYRVLPRINRSPPFDGINSKASDKKQIGKSTEKKQLPTPKELSLQASHIAQERYKWEKYHCMVEIQVKQMQKQQEEYDKNPEKHPEYPGEWKKFWNRRYKELQAEKKVDPNKYDYKPEWITYWKSRMIELFNVIIEKKKKEIKQKLDLREDDEENIDHLKEKYKISIPESPTSLGLGNSGSSITRNQRGVESPSDGRRSNRTTGEGSDVINISDDELTFRNYDRRRMGRRNRTRSRTPRRSRSRRRSRSFSMSPAHTVRHEYRRRYVNSRSRSRSPYDRERDRERDRRHSHSRQMSRERHSRHHDDYRGDMRNSERGDYYPTPLFSRSSHMYASPESGEHYRVMNAHDFPEYRGPGTNRSLSPSSLRQGKSASTAKESNTVEPEVDDGPLTIVGVLRMLSALEEHLGSLGPKTLDLLGKALAMEKVKANAADDLLLNDDYCVFLETIKEKLKGLLIADVLEEPQKVRVVKKVITNIAALIHQVNSKGNNKNAETNDDQNQTDRSKQILTRRSLPFDRQLVTSRLAAALVVQGCENITTPDMDKLLHFFVLLAKINKKLQTDGDGLNLNDLYSSLGIHRPKQMLVKSAKVSMPFLDEDLEKEVTDVVNEAIRSSPMERDSKPSGGDANNMSSLTDSELKLLLKNFKFLSNEEQDHLISHLKKLEKDEPLRVKNLRKYVDVTDLDEENSACGSILARLTHRNNAIGGSERCDSAATTSTRHAAKSQHGNIDRDRDSNRSNSNANKFTLDDDDDDDYNFDEVFGSNLISKSRSKSPLPLRGGGGGGGNITNINNKSQSAMPSESSLSALTFKPADRPKISLNDTENLIANLMGSLQQNAAASVKLNPSSSIDIDRMSNSQIGQSMTGNKTKSNQQTQSHMPETRQQQQMHLMQQQSIQPTPQQAMHNIQPGVGGSGSGGNNMPYYQQNSQQYPCIAPGSGPVPMGRYPPQQQAQPLQQGNPNMSYNPMYNYSNHPGANFAPYSGAPQQHQQQGPPPSQAGQWPQANGPPSAQYFMQQQQQPPTQMSFNMYGGRAGN